MNTIRLNQDAYIKFKEKEDVDTNSFWYTDTEFAIKDNPFILIDELFVSKEKRNIGLGTTLLNEVIMKNPNTIILVRSGLLMCEYPEEPTAEEYATVLNRLDDFYTNRGFTNINEYTKSYEHSELYVYTDNKQGKEFFNEIRQKYFYHDKLTIGQFIDLINKSVDSLDKYIETHIESDTEFTYYVSAPVFSIVEDEGDDIIYVSNCYISESDSLTVKDLINQLSEYSKNDHIAFEIVTNSEDYEPIATAVVPAKNIEIQEIDNRVGIIVYS